MEKTSEARRRASSKYDKANRERKKYTEYRAGGLRYIRRCRSIEELEEIEDLIDRVDVDALS